MLEVMLVSFGKRVYVKRVLHTMLGFDELVLDMTFGVDKRILDVTFGVDKRGLDVALEVDELVFALNRVNLRTVCS